VRLAIELARRADPAAVLDQPQADRVGMQVPVLEQLGRLRGAAVGAQALDV